MGETITSEFEGIPAAGMTLLRKLADNNDAEWARENGERLRTQLRDPFVRYLETVSARFAEEGIRLEGGADTTFRMRRDLRFTQDRRPLHEHVEGVLSPDRVRIGARAAIHVRLDRRGGFLSAGSFLVSPRVRDRLREVMVVRDRLFLRIARTLEEDGTPIRSEASLKRSPRGYEDYVDGPLGPYLRMQDPVARMELRVKDWRSGDVVERTVEFARRTHRWRLFQTEAIESLPVDTPRPPRSNGGG